MCSASKNILDLPDEILLRIMKNLSSTDVLYSLLTTNQRLDQMARSVNRTKFVNLSFASSDNQLSSFNDAKIARFCEEILPQIHETIIGLTLELSSLARVLLACEYPILDTIILTTFQPDMLSTYLKEGSHVTRMFEEKIRYVTVASRTDSFSSQSFTVVCADILTTCKNLASLNMNEEIRCCNAVLSISNVPPNVCFSSQLLNLSIKVATFEDCLCLLDGRLEQLFSLTVNIRVIRTSAMIENNEKILPNLKEFSLTSNVHTTAYDCRILSLLRRMRNLNRLTLRLDIMRSSVVDGIHLNEKIVSTMPHLNTFLFHLCTKMKTSSMNYLLTTNDVESTFTNWKYSPVVCTVDHFSDGFTDCHIYSKPFPFNRFVCLPGSLCGQDFRFLTSLSLFDTRPFEHDFFQWISETMPLLNFLLIHNLTAQEKKCQTRSVDEKAISSGLPYLHLVRLGLTFAHVDYAYQFLCCTNAYLPALAALSIPYEKLSIVTNGFTNDATRSTCGQLNEVNFKELIVHPEHFHQYFPSLKT